MNAHTYTGYPHDLRVITQDDGGIEVHLSDRSTGIDPSTATIMATGITLRSGGPIILPRPILPAVDLVCVFRGIEVRRGEPWTPVVVNGTALGTEVARTIASFIAALADAADPHADSEARVRALAAELRVQVAVAPDPGESSIDVIARWVNANFERKQG